MQKLLFKGPVTTSSGYGVHARQVLKALIASNVYDISVRRIGWGNTSIIHEETFFFDKINELSMKFEEEKASGFKDYDLSVQVTIPNEFEKLARVNIGITAGIEVNVVSPEWLIKANDIVDILFVPSNHSKSVFEGTAFTSNTGQELRLNKPAHLAHEGFNPQYFNTDHIKGKTLDFNSDFNFLFVGLGINKRYGEERKNISNLVKWFCETFKGQKDVGLVLKTAIVNNSLMDFKNTKAMLELIKKESGCGEFPKIHLIHGNLSDQEMANLYKNPKIKAFVSLTHGEGFGLPLLEAAACGLPIMATNWSGHLDFLEIQDGVKSFIPLDFELKNIPSSVAWKGVIEEGSQWAAVKEDDVKLKLRKVKASYEMPKQWATKLAEHVHENFTEGKVMYDLVQNIIIEANNFKRSKPTTQEELVDAVKSSFSEEDEGKKLLYTMPMSAGDVYISTAVVNGLKKKFPDHKIFFATSEQYISILENNPDIHKTIAYNEWMSDISICEQIFDEVYTPNLSVQMTFSNWVHKGKGRLLANELANQCNIELGDYYIGFEPTEAELPEQYIVLNPGSGQGQWEARNYTHWQEIVTNLARELGDIKIVQTGKVEDPFYEGCVDFRGKTKNFQQLAGVIKGSGLVLGIDSVTMHLAAGLDVNHIALFGSSYPTSTGPVVKGKSLSVLLETPDRRGCDKACYKYQCKVEKDYPCINEIQPSTIYHHVLDEVLDTNAKSYEPYQEINSKISGYTHVLNAKAGGYPFIQSITSMLGFCDEIIVVDGGSDDGTVEAIEAIGDDRIKIKVRKWDWDEPGMDGMQKTYGRAMCSGEFLWQQDVDEVVHERDYEKIRKLVKKFPKDCSLLHLPIVELWGDGKTVRTDRHSWKWRLSRNDFKITHGIVKHARVLDEKTGKIYAKPGQSDGCEYIDIMSNEYIQHKGFYNGQIEQIRNQNPQEYGKLMNQVFSQLPSVYHYSWADIPRKIKNFKQFWNKCWSNLYNEEKPKDRFPNVSLDDEDSINLKAQELKRRGGEHEQAETFQLENEQPEIMKSWVI